MPTMTTSIIQNVSLFISRSETNCSSAELMPHSSMLSAISWLTIVDVDGMNMLPAIPPNPMIISISPRKMPPARVIAFTAGDSDASFTSFLKSNPFSLYPSRFTGLPVNSRFCSSVRAAGIAIQRPRYAMTGMKKNGSDSSNEPMNKITKIRIKAMRRSTLSNPK